MNKQIILLAISVFFTIHTYAQITFENGYFIDEANQKINCLIKNIDWKDNPTTFEYKLSANEVVQTATIQMVKEFEITGSSKYIRAKVNLDRSSDELNKMTPNRNPVFLEELLFIKVLIEGKATLFVYQDGNLKRYLFKTADTEVEQLIYKRYKTAENQVAKNNTFRQQLFQSLKCDDINVHDTELLEYNKSNLERVFVKYNKCGDADYVTPTAKEKRDWFNLTIRPGLNISSLSIENSATPYRSTDFGTKLSPRLGIEAEFILPFNKNKWGVILEPTYQYFEGEESTDTPLVSGGKLITSIAYHSIEFPLGVRHYFFLKNESKIFVNASLIMDIITKQSLELRRADGSLLKSYTISTQRNFAFGAGYKLKNRFSLETRFQTSRELLNKYTNNLSSDYITSSIILGYSF